MTKKIKNRKAITLLVLLTAGLFFVLSFPIRAQECETVEECKALLEEYEKEIKKYEGNIEVNKEKQKTLNNKIYLLRQKISKLNYQIKKSSVVIRDLGVQIEDTESSIQNTTREIERNQELLADILQTVHEEDQKTSLEILLGHDEISDFFENVFALERLLARNHEVLEEMKRLKINLEEQKVSLDNKQEEWQKTKKIQILQKEESQRTKSEKEWVLRETRGEEEKYQDLLAENREKAQKIRERIFNLIGVPEAPTFGEALEIARYVEDVTGVRAALLLAVFRQESDIGKNVGQCYLKNKETGSGIVVASGEPVDRVMKPMGLEGRKGDVDAFTKICKELGRNPKNTLVSCPMSYGWGGAMGPAQFIPTTWMHYRNRVSNVTGRPADPWNIKDAFLAAGFLLKDAGAAKQTRDAEWCAAMVYFSGSCSSGYNFYGDSVMALADQYENDIEQIETYALLVPTCAISGIAQGI